jgi:hypothetical protein
MSFSYSYYLEVACYELIDDLSLYVLTRGYVFIAEHIYFLTIKFWYHLFIYEHHLKIIELHMSLKMKYICTILNFLDWRCHRISI